MILVNESKFRRYLNYISVDSSEVDKIKGGDPLIKVDRSSEELLEAVFSTILHIDVKVTRFDTGDNNETLIKELSGDDRGD